VSVEVPRKLSRSEKELLKQLQDAEKESPRRRLGVS
jgi:DnaJ-class molecular chaperone